MVSLGREPRKGEIKKTQPRRGGRFFSAARAADVLRNMSVAAPRLDSIYSTSTLGLTPQAMNMSLLRSF